MMEFLELILHDLLVTRAILWGCRHNFTGTELAIYTGQGVRITMH